VIVLEWYGSVPVTMSLAQSPRDIQRGISDGSEFSYQIHDGLARFE
jgi:hypothetical protein